MGVKIPAGQGIELLAQHTDGRVAHVIVQVLESGVDDRLALVLGDDHVVAVQAEHRLQKLHVGGENIGSNDGVLRFHFFCKID